MMDSAYCSGDLGDVVYTLAALKHRPDIKRLVLGSDLYGLRVQRIPPPYTGITQERFDFLRPLIEEQGLKCEYAEKNSHYHLATVDRFRLRHRIEDGYWKNIAEDIALELRVDPQVWRLAWLRVPQEPEIQGITVFSRSLKNWTHDSSFPWRKLLLESTQPMFLGTKEEHTAFCVYAGSIPYLPVKSALELAAIVKHALKVICNTSFVHSLAEALKVPVMVEMRPGFRHAYFRRYGALYWNGTEFVSTLPSPRRHRAVHVVMRYNPKSRAAEQRIMFAAHTWKRALYYNGVVPTPLWEDQFPRSSAEIFGDDVKAAFFKDVVRVGLEETQSDDDLIIWSNDDTVMHSNLYAAIQQRAFSQGADCFCSGRLNYEGDCSLDDLETCRVPMYQDAGHDLFVFKRRWLLEHWERIPDFLMVYSDWDCWMATYLRLYHKLPINIPRDSDWAAWPAEMPLGCIFHRRHSSRWFAPSIYEKSPCQHYEKILAYRSYQELGLSGKVHGSTPEESCGLF